jgi:uncharacterized short protein YbdD (DUF466 family)
VTDFEDRAMTMRKIGTGLASALWNWLREASGDDAYDRYLDHRRRNAAARSGEPLSRREFFRARQAGRWQGVRRCC